MTREVLMALIAMLLAVNTVFAGNGGKVKWTTNYNEGMKEAKKTGKATMLYFTEDG